MNKLLLKTSRRSALLFSGAIVLFIINCTTVYTIHIKTIPEGDYDIYFDKKLYGVMPPDGDTTIQFPEMSTIRAPLLEVKNVNYYGCFQLNTRDSVRRAANVSSYSSRGYSARSYNVVFDLKKPVAKVPAAEPARDTILSPEERKKLSSTLVHYCIADLQLLQKGVKAYDYDNTEYKIMKQMVDDNVAQNAYSWVQVDADLSRRITLGLADDTTSKPDSLPYAAWDRAISNGIKYIVVFYGYSQLESRTVAPGTAGAAVALTALGILAGRYTGMYTFVYPTGQDRKSVMDSYCSIFSIDSNTCLYTTKASITSFNSSGVEKQITGLYKRLFENIRPFFAGNAAKN